MSESLNPQLQQQIPEDAYCEKHHERPLLFCDDDQITLCGKCFQSPEHKNHMVYGVQEAAENYKKLFQGLLTTLMEKLEVAKTLLAEEQERMVMVLREEQNFKEMIEAEYQMMCRLMTEEKEMNCKSLQECISNQSQTEASLSEMVEFCTEIKGKSQKTLQVVKQVFKKMVELANKRHYQLLYSNKEMLLQNLKTLGRENLNKLKENEVSLFEHICSLQKVTAEIKKKCGESGLALLQDAKDLERSGWSLLLHCLEPAQITDLSLCQIPGMSKLLKAFQRPITLDPKTAHPYLVLSEDVRSVRLRNVQQAAPGHPGRFDFRATVLSVESFTSGRHYWEVDVEKAAHWQLGICEDSASRKGDIPKDSGDKVLLMGFIMGTDWTFWVFPPLKRVSLAGQMHKVGVFLDYKYQQISFYDVKKKLLIYTFSHLALQGALKPMFSLCIPNGGTNSDSLTICLPDVSSCNMTASPPSSLV